MIGKVRQDSAKFSNWRPKATELGRFVSYLVGDGMDCLSQAECDALAHGPRRGWPNRRIHAPKAEALLSGSDYGRGFGSVFHLKGQMAETGDFGPKQGTFVQATARNRTSLRLSPSPVRTSAELGIGRRLDALARAQRIASPVSVRRPGRCSPVPTAGSPPGKSVGS